MGEQTKRGRGRPRKHPLKEETDVKRPRGRPKMFTPEELRSRKTARMLNAEWYCDICATGINYSLAGKHGHLGTKGHTKLANLLKGLD